MTKRTRNIVLGLVLVLVVALVALRIALPTLVQGYVNRTLDRHPVYDGHVGNVDIALLRGAYAVDDVEIVKQSGEVPEPLFAADRVDLSILWSAVWQGALRGEVVMFGPALNFVNGDRPAEGQDGTEETGDWRDIVLDLFPVRIDRLEIRNGTVHYVDRTTEPMVVDVHLGGVQAVVTNLTNIRETTEPDGLPARLEVRGSDDNYGSLDVVGGFDPFGDDPTLDLDLELLGMRVDTLNEMFEQKGRFDVEQGTMDVYLELAAREGRFEGYVKPLLHDLKVLDRDDLKDKPLAAAADAVVGAVKGILTNKKTKQLATRIPVSGTFDDPDVGAWRAVLSALGNAFVEALSNGLDNTVRLSDVEPTADPS